MWLQNMLAAAEPSTVKQRVSRSCRPCGLAGCCGGRRAAACRCSLGAQCPHQQRLRANGSRCGPWPMATCAIKHDPSDAVEALQNFATMCWPLAERRAQFFSGTPPVSASPTNAGLFALTQWSRELTATARTVEHPYNPVCLKRWPAELGKPGRKVIYSRFLFGLRRVARQCGTSR
jgi:hypothetical protein